MARRAASIASFFGLALAGATLAAACGPSPENPGDPCDPDDGCPNGLICAAGGEDNICYIPAGTACAGTGTDYCRAPSHCVDKVCQVPTGGPCVSGGPDVCEGDSVCGMSNVCEIPPGGACDPATMPDLCLDANVCGKTLDGMGICGTAEGGECDPTKPLCAGGLVCAERQSGKHTCERPMLVEGMVFDAQSKAGITGAHVIALDDHAVAITNIAVSDATGNYVLDVPILRDDTGAPVKDYLFTLRGSAHDYETFPGGLRTALPNSSNDAMKMEQGYVIKTAITDIALLGVPDAEKGRATISGTVLAAERSAGVLVVAEGMDGTGVSAISDKAGAYTIFNVPDGATKVNGYASGLQLDPKDVTVAKMDVAGVDLSPSAAALGSISGNVNIVNAPGGSLTSVVLVVASTFDDTFVRGDVPRGLRAPLFGAPSISGAFTIPDVPAGKYVVLAAFENDGLVRDPDPNISGTQIVTVDMPTPGMAVSLPTSFKVTEALPVVGPGKDDPEAVTTAPMLAWGDDSSEDFYTVVVYDAYGDLVWCLSDLMPMCDGPNVPKVSGGGNVSVPYGGPLEKGMYYQFRATSWRAPGGMPGPISTTEDLRGVFFVAP